jgi:hypothetical protein
LLENNILFWISEELIHFFIAKFLSEKNSGKFSAIIEGHPGLKDFFQNQKIVDFNKTWFLYDYVIGPFEKPDIEYLKSFETRYDLNLWEIAFSERIFYPEFNKYYTFNHDEILSILEKHCKLYEEILDSVKPEFLLVNLITRLPNYLLFRMCKSKGIKVITLEWAKFGGRTLICQEIDRADGLDNMNIVSSENTRTFEELKGYLKKNKPYSGFESKPTKKLSKLKKLKDFSLFLLNPINSDYQKMYVNYGKSKWNLLTKGSRTSLKIKKNLAQNFFDKNLKNKIDEQQPFLFFSLQSEPERDLLVLAPYYSDQITIIKQIAKSLPVGYKLFVKDHPIMSEIGWRNIEYYKQIMALPNVTLLHPSIKSNEIIKKCSVVLTIAGTPGFEALFEQKPVIVFSDIDYSVLPSVLRVQKIEDLPILIRSALKLKVESSSLDKFVKIIDKSSIYFDKYEYIRAFNNIFDFKGFSKTVSLSNNEIIKIMNDFSTTFKMLGDAHFQKIKTMLNEKR